MISHAGVDTATDKLTGAMLRAAGKAFVCRYVQNAPGSTFDKEIQGRAELADKTAHGVRVVANWEWEATQKNSRSDGQADANRWLARREALGIPEWAPCYYSIDYPAAAGSHNAYAQGWLDELPREQIGCYGDGALFRQLKADGYIKYAWQSMSRDFPGNHVPGTTTWDHRGADIIQTTRTKIGGFDCDLDTAVVDDYGGFLLGEDDPMTITPDDIKTIAAEVVRQLKADPQWIDLTWRTKAIADLDTAFLNGSMKGAPVALTKTVKAIPTAAAPAAPLGAAELAAIAKAVNDDAWKRQAS